MDQRLTCDKAALEEISKFGRHICEIVPELSGIGFVLSWQVGQTDFPPGSIYLREEDKAPPQHYLALIDQTRKMLSLQVEAIEYQLSELERINYSLIKKIEENKLKLTEQNDELKKLNA